MLHKNKACLSPLAQDFDEIPLRVEERHSHALLERINLGGCLVHPHPFPPLGSSVKHPSRPLLVLQHVVGDPVKGEELKNKHLQVGK